MVLKNDNFHNMLGLARRAGKAVTGGSGVEAAVRTGKAMLVILAEDASQSTSKRLKDKCKSYTVPIIVAGTKQSLGKINGRDEAAAVAITDSNFAGGLKRISEEIYGGVCNG